MYKPALVLNTDGVPLRVISWKRAICLEIIGNEMPGEGITVLKYYKDHIKSAGGLIVPLPAVAMTNRYININRQVPLTKTNVIMRDKSRCQYCNIHLNAEAVTIDHIIPKKMFKNKLEATTWSNVVVACRPCNIKKGGRTPSQAKMLLINKPYEPNIYNFWHFQKLPEWDEFLGYN